jgi:inner membrane transporter RhtA
MKIPAWAMTVVAMASVQFGSAFSVPLIAMVGPAGTAWIRLSIGALILWAIARPKLSMLARRDIPSILALGATLGIMTSAFLAALAHIPLGTAVAIEFLGPLGVAAFAHRAWKSALWPAVALIGVVVLTEPWSGTANWIGIGFAALAAIGWAAYIVLTQHVGDRFSGIQGLALSSPIAALTASVVGIPQAWDHFSWDVLAWGFFLALLIPVIPYALEMLALKRMNKRAFGTLMAIEPAIGATVGLIILNQVPTSLYLFGIVLVVCAGIATQRDSGRPSS